MNTKKYKNLTKKLLSSIGIIAVNCVLLSSIEGMEECGLVNLMSRSRPSKDGDKGAYVPRLFNAAIQNDAEGQYNIANHQYEELANIGAFDSPSEAQERDDGKKELFKRSNINDLDKHATTESKILNQTSMRGRTRMEPVDFLSHDVFRTDIFSNIDKYLEMEDILKFTSTCKSLKESSNAFFSTRKRNYIQHLKGLQEKKICKEEDVEDFNNTTGSDFIHKAKFIDDCILLLTRTME